MLSSAPGKRITWRGKYVKHCKVTELAVGQSERPGALTVALLWESNVAPFASLSTMATALPRPLKGSRISTFYPIKSVPALSTLDSAFQLQEFISLTIRADIHDVSAIISVPDTRTSAEGGGSDDSSATLNDDIDGDRDTRGEFAVDEACWIYEQLRYVELRPLVSRPTSSKLITRSQDASRRTFLIP